MDKKGKNTSIISVESISQLNQLLNQGRTAHPLITIIDLSKIDLSALSKNPNQKWSNSFYSIILKKLNTGSLQYGRGHYDFQEGSLFFMAPNQVFGIDDPGQEDCVYGWGIYFHPDLIYGTSLFSNLSDYTFFNYTASEALHISEQEKQTLSNIRDAIIDELNRPIDKHSSVVIVSNLELLLNHCLRYYDRQFISRKSVNHDAISKFESFLTSYFDSTLPIDKGLPTVKQCAEHVNLSVNYLSDLLKKETGKSAQEHIHHQILEQAKNRLARDDKTVSEIAYELGFEYPQYFSKLFKRQTGLTPMKYRKSH